MIKISLGPGSVLWEKGEKNGCWPKTKSASEASREVVWGGERVAAPFPLPRLPQDTARLALFADIFPI